MKSILVLTMYGDLAASSRQRVGQYIEILQKNNFNIQVEPLFPNEYLEDIFNTKKPSFIKILYWYLKRLNIVVRSSNFDLVWIQYELFPQLPSIFESIILFCNKNFILDYDDAIFHKYDLWGNSFSRLFLRKKLELLASKSKAIICGNSYIKEWADKHCQNTVLIPTVINFEKYNGFKVKKSNSLPVIGWIGSPATWLYMEPLIELLDELSSTHNFEILIVGSGHHIDLQNFTFKSWNEESEISDIASMDIGIMPLFEDPWALGKCGYKLIQYMACSKPVIASPVGVNCNIVEEGVNGFFANTADEWKAAIIKLVSDKNLRNSMGNAGALRINESFSFDSQASNLLKLLHDVNDA